MFTDTFRLNAVPISGIDELEESDDIINVFQHNNSVEIAAKIEIERVAVFSMEGKKIADTNIRETNFTIDLSAFAKGSYFLLLETKSRNGITQYRTKKIYR